jgi:hypothetical protein
VSRQASSQRLDVDISIVERLNIIDFCDAAGEWGSVVPIPAKEADRMIELADRRRIADVDNRIGGESRTWTTVSETWRIEGWSGTRDIITGYAKRSQSSQCKLTFLRSGADEAGWIGAVVAWRSWAVVPRCPQIWSSMVSEGEECREQLGFAA